MERARTAAAPCFPTFRLLLRCASKRSWTMKPIITWVVVADGGKLRIFENRGPGKGLIPVQGLNREDVHLRDKDIEADRPGRSYSSLGRGRSSMEPQTD